MDEIDNHLYNIKSRLKNKIQSIDIDTADNKVLAIPFEYYVVIQLSDSTKTLFFQSLINPQNFKKRMFFSKTDILTLNFKCTLKFNQIFQSFENHVKTYKKKHKNLYLNTVITVIWCSHE